MAPIRYSRAKVYEEALAALYPNCQVRLNHALRQEAEKYKERVTLFAFYLAGFFDEGELNDRNRQKNS